MLSIGILFFSGKVTAQLMEPVLNNCGLKLPKLPNGWSSTINSSSNDCVVTYKKNVRRKQSANPPSMSFSRYAEKDFGMFSKQDDEWTIESVYPQKPESIIELKNRTIMIGEFLERANCGTRREPLSCTGSHYVGMVLFKNGEKVEIDSTVIEDREAMEKIARGITLLSLPTHK